MRRLTVRLFASYALIVSVGVLTVYVTVRLLAPRLFDDKVGMMGQGAGGAGSGMGAGMGPGAGGGAGANGAQLHAAFGSALDTSLLVGLAASVLAAGVATVFVARRLLRPLDAVRRATRRLAEGHYTEKVPVPREAELAALAIDVNNLASTLAETEHRRVQLISEVAHELRTPLTTIDGYMEGLLDGVFEPTPEILSGVSDEVARLRRLAADLSALSRTEEGALDLDLGPADLTELAARTAERLRPQFEDAGLELDVRPGAPLPVRADPQRIAQVLTNLMGNALNYTPQGGHVSVCSGTDATGPWVTVTDTGVGLDPTELGRVFERFYRVPRATDADSGQGDPGHPDSAHRGHRPQRLRHRADHRPGHRPRARWRRHRGLRGARQGRDLHPAAAPGRDEGRLTPGSCPRSRGVARAPARRGWVGRRPVRGPGGDAGLCVEEAQLLAG